MREERSRSRRGRRKHEGDRAYSLTRSVIYGLELRQRIPSATRGPTGNGAVDRSGIPEGGYSADGLQAGRDLFLPGGVAGGAGRDAWEAGGGRGNGGGHSDRARGAVMVVDKKVAEKEKGGVRKYA